MLLLAHAALTFVITGMMLVVQAGTYPMMSYVDRARFVEYELAWTALAKRTIGPMLFVEFGTGVALAGLLPTGVPAAAAWANLGLLAVIWASTVVWQLPMHRRLAAGWDDDAHRRLVRTNWARTVCYLARCGLMLGLLSLSR